MIGLDQTIASGGGGAIDRREEVSTPTPAQTVFPLLQAPTVPNDTSMFINKVKYVYGPHYTVAGSTLTYLPGGAGFALDAQDQVEIIYFV